MVVTPSKKRRGSFDPEDREIVVRGKHVRWLIGTVVGAVVGVGVALGGFIWLRLDDAKASFKSSCNEAATNAAMQAAALSQTHFRDAQMNMQSKIDLAVKTSFETFEKASAEGMASLTKSLDALNKKQDNYSISVDAIKQASIAMKDRVDTLCDARPLDRIDLVMAAAEARGAIQDVRFRNRFWFAQIADTRGDRSVSISSWDMDGSDAPIKAVSTSSSVRPDELQRTMRFIQFCKDEEGKFLQSLETARAQIRELPVGTDKELIADRLRRLELESKSRTDAMSRIAFRPMSKE